MNKLNLVFLLILTVTGVYTPANADEKSQRSHITQLVQHFIEQQLVSNKNEKIAISVNKIDRRIKIKSCDVPLTLSLAGKNKLVRHTTVSVKCQNIWKMYIPVKIKRMRLIVVSTQPLSAGTMLSSANIALAYQDILQLRGSTITSLTNIAGAKLIRQVQSGQAITSNLLCLVCKGDPVEIYAHSGNLTIKSTGVALKNGVNGQVIAVRNTSSGRIIEATIAGVATVKIKI